MSWLSDVEPLAPRFVPGARIRVVHEGDGWVAVDKPAGLLTVPGRGPERADCVEAQVRADHGDAWAVHRLDLETSGLVVVATRRDALVALSRAFEERRVQKAYVAVVDGVLDGGGLVDAPIGPGDRPRFAVVAGGRPSRTRWTVVGVDGGRSRLALAPETGRTHQLRLHCAHVLRAPIVGDSLYGDPASADRLLLHAERLVVPDPVTGEAVALVSAPPF